MDRDLSAGPAAGVAWATVPGGVMVLPDAANLQRAAAGLGALYHGLPATPRLARDAGGRPVLTLTLALQRRPTPDEDSVFELVESATLACDITLALPDGTDDDVLPLFARDAALTLERDVDGMALVQVRGSGAGWRAGLAARLDRRGAQALLAALDGQASGLALHCQIDYRAAGAREQLRLVLRWTAIRAVISKAISAARSVEPAGYVTANAGADDTLPDTPDSPGDSDAARIDGAGLRALMPDLVETEAVRAWRIAADGAEQPLAPDEADALWPAFATLSSVLLERLTPALAPTDPQARFALRPGPAQSGEMATRWTLGAAREGRVELHAALDAVLGGALAGQRVEDFIHLVCPDPAVPGAYAPAPPRQRVTPTRSGPDTDAPASATGLALVGRGLMSMTRALTPDRGKAAPLAAALASDAVRFEAQPVGATHAFAFQAIELAENGKPSLPWMDRNVNTIWRDYSGRKLWWYPPEFELVQPDPAGTPEASPFLFSFHEAGHDAAGQPVLEGAVRCTLRRHPSAATLAALAIHNNEPAQPVAPIGIAASLSVPVRDGAGQLRRIDLAGTVSDDGDTLVVEVALLGDTLRATYGALALTGFQSEPARLQVAYSFDAMVDAKRRRLTLAYAGKLAQTPVAYTTAQQTQLAGRAYMDAVQLAYRAPVSDLRFKREAATAPAAAALEPALEPAFAATDEADAGAGPKADLRSDRPGPALTTGSATLAPVATHAQASSALVAIRPQLENAALQQELLQRSDYVRQTQGRRIALDAFFPCNTLGAFYCQQQDDTLAAIGCREAFSLGQVPFKLYEPVSDPGLTGLPCQVLRSLSQPGRFVLLPAAYLITRFGPGEGERAYRPAIYLYSSVDADVPANNRCVLMATLQPDLSQDQRHRIDAVLAALHPHPVLDAVTAIDCAVKQSAWLAGLAPEVARLWDGFQITLSTDPAGALLLQDMLRHGGAAASVTFTLADGTELSSSLQLDLNRLTGPWDGGPVQVTADGANAVLTNRIERPVDVSDLAVVDGGGGVTHVAVERQLAPGEAVSVALPAGTAPGWAVLTIPPGDAATLAEIRSFVEDIQTNVLFINIINYANHGLRRLDLRARLKEVPGSERAVTMNDEQTTGEANFMLPLTVYQGPRTLQFQVTKTDAAGAVSATGWLEADLRAGNAVTLTWDLIA